MYNIVTSLATLVPKLNNTVNVQYIETRNEECDEWFVISVATNELVEWYAQAQAVNYGMCTVFFFWMYASLWRPLARDMLCFYLCKALVSYVVSNNSKEIHVFRFVNVG